MTEEQVTFTPRTPVRRPVKKLEPCSLCHGAHASWWTNVQAPSCVERQKRAAKA
jgi:hypothetical protein